MEASVAGQSFDHGILEPLVAARDAQSKFGRLTGHELVERSGESFVVDRFNQSSVDQLDDVTMSK